MKVSLPETPSFDTQMCRLGAQSWSVARLAQLASKLDVMDIPLAHLNMYNTYERLTLREFACHMKTAQDADMTHPIILDEDGEIMDGRHRIIRALVEGRETIRAFRFDKNPAPCRMDEE